MPDVIDIIGPEDGGGGGLQSPNPPTGLTASNIATDRVTLSWVLDPTALEYRITYLGVTISNITSNSYTVIGLSPNTSYTFSVRVITSLGLSTSSSPVTVRTLTTDQVDPPPNTPGEPVDRSGSFLFMTEYNIPSGNTGEVVIKYRVGKMSTGLFPEVITRTTTKESLIANFGLDPSLEGTKTYNPKEYGL